MVITTMRFYGTNDFVLSAIVDFCSLQIRYGRSQTGCRVGDVLAVSDAKRSTVYRAFKHLCENGLIECVSMEGTWKFIATERGYEVYNNLWGVK